jgi:protein SCO1
MTTQRLRWLLVVAAACAALAGFWLAQELDRQAPRLASGTWLPQPKRLEDFRLTDISGAPFTLANLAGGPALVYFGFTRCPDVCPTTLLKLAQVVRVAGIAGLRVVFISIDPQRDTPPVLALYVHAFDPSFQGLTGDPRTITRVAAEFAVAVSRVDLPGGNYTMDHTAAVFLLDARANEVAIFTPPFDVAAFAADLKRARPYLGGGRNG